jgi:hypothetical protein
LGRRRFRRRSRGALGSGRCGGVGTLGRRASRLAVAGGLVDRLVEGLVQRLVGGLGGALSGGRLAPSKGFTEPASDRCLYGRRRGFNEFALFIQPGENFLTGDTEFLSQLVYAGLTCHYISCLRGDSRGPRLGFSYDALSSGLHGVLMFFATYPVAGMIGRTQKLYVLDHRGCIR